MSRELFFYEEGDYFSSYVNEALFSLDVSLHKPLINLFNIFKNVELTKPNKKFENNVNSIIENIIGIENYKIISTAIIEILIETKVVRDLYSDKNVLLAKYNADIFKNFLFSTIKVLDNNLINSLVKLVIKHHAIVPSIANASVYVISRYKNSYAISSLGIIRSKVKAKQVQKLIDKYINEIAVSNNLSVYELEDMSVPDFGLVL